jgi:hypothetical protein
MSAGSGAGTAFDGTVVGGAIGSGLDKEIDDLDAMTDEMGWSYGGNKWESLSSKGGLGKFTRRRRCKLRSVSCPFSSSLCIGSEADT